MASKINHHFIPQFYLRNFADGTGRQARLFTFDYESKRNFTTRVRNVGSKRYFNRVLLDGVDPDIIEDETAKFEAVAAEYLKEVIEFKEFVSEDHFNSVMNLMAMVAVRNPRFRQQFSKFNEEIAQTTLSLLLASEDRWESLTNKMRNEGVPLKEDITYQDIKEFHERGEYDVVVNQNYLIKMEIDATNFILEPLMNRNWCFVEAPDGYDFITSDDPVVLTWSHENKDGIYPPGFGLKGTVVYFPLSPKLLLVGTFEDAPRNSYYTPMQVTLANTVIARKSNKQIYAKNGSFRLNLKDRNNVAGNQLSNIINRM